MTADTFTFGSLTCECTVEKTQSQRAVFILSRGNLMAVVQGAIARLALALVVLEALNNAFVQAATCPSVTARNGERKSLLLAFAPLCSELFCFMLTRLVQCRHVDVPDQRLVLRFRRPTAPIQPSRSYAAAVASRAGCFVL